MNEQNFGGPIDEMSAAEMEKEIEHLSRRTHVNIDVATGRRSVTAFPIDSKYSPIVKSGMTAEDAFGAVLVELRRCRLPPGLRRL